MDPIQALVFDFDGLILDTEVPEFTTVRETFEEHGQQLLLEDWRERIGRADQPHWLDWLEELHGGPLPDRDGVRQRRIQRHHALIALNEIRDGVLDLLAEADGLAIPAAVASSSDTDWVEGHLGRFGLLDRFATIVTRDHVERAKPWPDLFLEACRRVDADPSSAVAFEDSHHGCVAAKAAGLYCVVVPNDITRGHHFDQADLVVDSLADVTIRALGSRLPAPNLGRGR